MEMVQYTQLFCNVVFQKTICNIRDLKKWRNRFCLLVPIAIITIIGTLSGEKVMTICGENTTDAPNSVKMQERTKTAWTHKSMRFFVNRKRNFLEGLHRPEERKEKQRCGSN